jgi:hypothetical protein
MSTRHRTTSYANFDTDIDTDSYSTTRAYATVQPARSRLVSKGNHDLPLRSSIGSQYRHGEKSPLSTPKVQLMIATERLRRRINDSPAGWSSTFDIVHQCNTDHDTPGLCVTAGAADWKS